MQVNTNSDLIEVLLTPEEQNRAAQLMDKNLSIMYLTNTRIGVFRALAEQLFSKPEEDGENHRVRAYLRGQYDILGSIIDAAMNPPPVPLQESAGNSFPSSTFNPSPEA